MSYTEFTYQLLQAYDFSYLFEKHNVQVQARRGAAGPAARREGTDFAFRRRGGLLSPSALPNQPLSLPQTRAGWGQRPVGEHHGGDGPDPQGPAARRGVRCGARPHRKHHHRPIARATRLTLRAALTALTRLRVFPHAPACAGLTFPLLLRSDGKKFGKSEEGAVWLTTDKCGGMAACTPPCAPPAPRLGPARVGRGVK